MVFESIARQFQVSPKDVWAIGDVWETDLLPAQSLGMSTIKIGEMDGFPTLRFDSVEQFLESI